MHAFLNKFITRNNLLIQFVKQHDNCLGSRKQRERELDAADFYTVIPCATKSSIEAQFQYVYTHEKFKKVQTQFREKVHCITISTHSALGYMVYEVVEQVSNSIFNKFAVTYDRISAEVKCQCLLFESRGILCCHSLSALSFERNAKRRQTHIKSGHDEPLLEPISKRFDNLVFRSQNIYEFASECEELTAILHCTYDNVMVEMQEYKAKSKEKSLKPPRVRTRGCLKNRLGSKTGKQIANASKKKKTKALSKLNLFYGGSLAQSNSSQHHGHVMNYQFRDLVA
ncbi:hypothetical protein Ahy_A02g009289 [Arachis hypogaea]|uniref:Protein FAR1-RELATED SEQUENCE n=1 Tax=Arachis hypogaea TaxID=3818 RepID=A0A445EGL0_ARAHY|nr:hypothetical protein Ahy_A02g009289 [Arachis hypogaea]